jgi:ribosomal protein L37AE/L43A
MRNNNNNNRRTVNTVTKPTDYKNRFCNHCHIQLVFDPQHDIYKCPRCNVSTVFQNTEPDVKIRTTFPTYDPTLSANKTHVIQSKNESLPRSEQFIRKRLAEKNAIEDYDPYLNMLKQKNEIRITNVEYYSYEDTDHLYD